MGPRPRRLGLETYPWFRLGATSKCLGLDLDLSGLEPIAIFIQIYMRPFVTKTLSPRKLNRSVLVQNSIKLSVFHRCDIGVICAFVSIAEVKSKLL